MDLEKTTLKNFIKKFLIKKKENNYGTKGKDYKS